MRRCWAVGAVECCCGSTCKTALEGGGGVLANPNNLAQNATAVANATGRGSPMLVHLTAHASQVVLLALPSPSQEQIPLPSTPKPQREFGGRRGTQPVEGPGHPIGSFQKHPQWTPQDVTWFPISPSMLYLRSASSSSCTHDLGHGSAISPPPPPPRAVGYQKKQAFMKRILEPHFQGHSGRRWWSQRRGERLTHAS